MVDCMWFLVVLSTIGLVIVLVELLGLYTCCTAGLLFGIGLFTAGYGFCGVDCAWWGDGG